MPLFDFLFGNKEEEQQTQQPFTGSLTSVATPASPPPLIEPALQRGTGAGSSVAALPTPANPPQINAPRVAPGFAELASKARESNEARAREERFTASKTSLRNMRLVNEDVLEDGNIDEIADEIINSGRQIADRAYLSKEETPGIKSLARPFDFLSQVGEGVISGGEELIGRGLEIAGLEDNLFMQVTEQQKFQRYREFLEEHAPERIPEFQSAIRAQGHSPVAEAIGRGGEALVEGFATGAGIYKAVSVLPAMQKLYASGKWGRRLYTGIANVAADVGIRAEMAAKNKQSAEEVMRGVASSPSILFGFFSAPLLAVGLGTDVLMGKINGLPLSENLINAAMNLGGNAVDLRGLKSFGDADMRSVKRAFLENLSGQEKKIASQAWEEMELIHTYAQANPHDVPGVVKMNAEAEKRLLAFKKKVETESIIGERRLIQQSGPDRPSTRGEAPEPEPKLKLGKARQLARQITDNLDDIRDSIRQVDELDPVTGLRTDTEFGRTQQFAGVAQDLAGAGALRRFGIRKITDLENFDSPGIRSVIRKGLDESIPGTKEAERFRKALTELPDDINDEQLRQLFSEGKQKKQAITEKLQDAISEGFAKEDDFIDEGITVGDVLDSLIAGESRQSGRTAATRVRNATGQTPREVGEVPGVRERSVRPEDAEPILSPAEKSEIRKFEEGIPAQRQDIITPESRKLTEGLPKDSTVRHSPEDPARSKSKTPMQEGQAELRQHPEAKGKAKSYEDTVKSVSNDIPLEDRVHIFDMLRTPWKVLDKIGLAKEAKFAKKRYREYLVELPKELAKVEGWAGRVKGEEANTRIFKFLDGQMKAKQLSDTELDIAQEIQQYLIQWADRLGLPPQGRISNYITRLWDKGEKGIEFDQDLAKLIDENISGSVYNPFLRKRKGAIGYKTDTWQALDAYVKRAVRKEKMDAALEQLKHGAKDLDAASYDYVKSIVSQVNLQPTNRDRQLDNFLKKFVGHKFGDRPGAASMRSMRRVIYRGTLGMNFSSIMKNLTQGVNTYAKLGERWTTTGYYHIMKNMSMGNTDELISTGILQDNLIQDRTMSAAHQFWEKFDRKLFFLWDNVEKINRGAAYYGAKAKAINQGKPEAQAIEEAIKLVEDTQFVFGPLDTPELLGSDLARTGLQFQSFTIKQAEFLFENALRGDKKAQFLTRYIVGSIVMASTIGEAIGMDLDEFIPGMNIFEEGRLPTPPVLSFPAEMVQAMLGVTEFDTPSNQSLPDRLFQAVKQEGTKLIPGGIQMRKSLEGAESIGNRKVTSRTGDRTLFRVKDNLQNRIRAVLFGKYGTDEGKAYSLKKFGRGRFIQKVQDSIVGTGGAPAQDNVPGFSDLPPLPDLPPLEDNLPALPPLPGL